MSTLRSKSNRLIAAFILLMLFSQPIFAANPSIGEVTKAGNITETATDDKKVVNKVDVNTADAWMLAALLKGIGPKKARAIVSYRAKHGPFANVEQLQRVKGIGPKLIEKIRARVNLPSVTSDEDAEITVNINTSDADTMANQLYGIGIVKATAIVKWRTENGEFKSKSDLLKVRGIGKKLLMINTSMIILVEQVEPVVDKEKARLVR